jgi:cell wall-associated NlpC family hydrolase
MPAILRTARACALALATLGLTATTFAAAPSANAAPGSGTVNLSTTDVREGTLVTQRRLAARRTVARRVLSAKAIAMNQRGDLYAYGAAGPARFDCSGLIYYSYRRAGFNVPRTSSAQAGHTRRIAKQNMRTGDLMFFYGGGGVYHAAIFLGWSRGHAVMLHSPGSGQRVRVAATWTSRWFGGTLRR